MCIPTIRFRLCLEKWSILQALLSLAYYYSHELYITEIKELKIKTSYGPEYNSQVKIKGRIEINNLWYRKLHILTHPIIYLLLLEYRVGS